MEQLKPIEALTDEEINAIYTHTDEIIKWCKAIQDYVLNNAVNNNKIVPGYKLTTGRAIRKWNNEDEVLKRLKEEGYTEEQLVETKVLSVSKLEKICGKSYIDEFLSDLVETPAGKPKLVKDKNSDIEEADLAEIFANCKGY